MHFLDVPFTVDVMYGASSAREKSELGLDLYFVPCETLFDGSFRIVMPTAREKAFDAFLLRQFKRDDLIVRALVKDHCVVPSARLVRPAGKTIGDNVLFPCEFFNECVCGEVDRHEIGHPLPDPNDLVCQFSGVTATRDHVAQELSHIDVNDASVGALLQILDEKFYLRALAGTLRPEEQNGERMHITRDCSPLF